MKTSVAVAMAAIAATLSVAQAQFTPQWREGDWWVVKQWGSDLRGGAQWQHWRYDVLGVEPVGGRDCFVLRRGDTSAPPEVCAPSITCAGTA